MKKLILSLSIIGAITIGTGAIAFAAEENTTTLNNEGTVVTETSDSTEVDNSSTGGNPNCPYYEEGCNGQGEGQGLGQCNGQGQGNGQGPRNGEGNKYGLNSENKGRGACGGNGSGMMGARWNSQNK